MKKGFDMEKVLRILLVEDEIITAFLMQEELKDIGYAVSQHVTSGEDAIISAKQNSSDLILMDIRLAGKIDGIEAASIIKSENNIPVIFITGYEDQAIRERAELLNPLGYLIKPLDMNKLKTIIDKHYS